MSFILNSYNIGALDMDHKNCLAYGRAGRLFPISIRKTESVIFLKKNA